MPICKVRKRIAPRIIRPIGWTEYQLQQLSYLALEWKLWRNLRVRQAQSS